MKEFVLNFHVLFTLGALLMLVGFRNLTRYALYNPTMTPRRMLDSFGFIFIGATMCFINIYNV